MQEPKFRLSLDELRVTSFAPLPENDGAMRDDGDGRAGPTVYPRCSVFICD